MIFTPIHFEAPKPDIDLAAILDELRPALRSGIGGLAEAFRGAPNKRLSSRSEWRWGNKGSFNVFVSGPKQGLCSDHERGWHGDGIRLIREERGCDFESAVLWGAAWAGISTDGRKAGPEDTAIRAVREAERERQRAEQQAAADAKKAKQTTDARRLWDASTALGGTVAERYLTETRGIPRPFQGWPDAVRFHPGSRALIVAATIADGAVQFVQRVYLTPDAQKISSDELRMRGLPNVKHTTSFMDGAYAKLPGAADGPLMLAEGPETGLSVWAATGHETWLSCGPLPRHNPPLDRKVVICRDDDKHTSPADKGVKDAVSRWMKTGADVVIVTPWPVRRQDKSDFNDVIQAGGLDAVRSRISAALEPPHKPIKRLPVAEGRIALRAAVDTFYAAAAGYDDKLKQAEATAKSELTANAEFAPEVLEARQAWADARAAGAEARRLAAVRPATGASREAAQAAKDAARAARDAAKLASEQAAEFKADTAKIQADIRKQAKVKASTDAGPYPVHGIKVDVGAGKSEASLVNVARIVKAMRSKRDKRTVVIAIPSHALGDQQVERFTSIPEATGLTATVWRSRKAKLPDEQPMCLDPDAVADAEEALADVQTAVCRKKLADGSALECPHFAECPFQQQRNLKPDVWFIAHELLFNQKPAVIGAPAILAVDESACQDGLFGIEHKILMLRSTLLNEDATVPGEPLATGQLQASRRTLDEALSVITPNEDSAPIPVTRASMIACGIDVAAAGEAYSYEWKRKREAGIYPGMPRKSRKEAVQAVVHNKLVQKLGMAWKAIGHLVADDGPEKSGCISVGMSKTKDGTAPAIYIKGRREVHESWHVPTLILDATMQPDLVRPFWPTMDLTADIRLQTPHQHVVQVIDRSYSKKQIEKASGLRDVRAIICRVARHYAPERVLAVVQKDVEDAIKDIGSLPPNLGLAHHNAIAGRDEWGPGLGRDGVAALLVVGRTAPSPAAVEDMAEALTGAAVDRIPGMLWYPKADAYREMADGTIRRAETDRHPHPIAEAIRWQIAEGEIVQIVGRPRGVNRDESNPVDVLLMTNAPLPIPVERCISKTDLHPSPDDLMMAAGGVSLKNSTDAAAAYPKVWDTPNAAKLAFQRWDVEVGSKSGSGCHPVIGYTYYERTPTSEIRPNLRTAAYQVFGQGRGPTLACYDPALIPDIEAWLTGRVGHLSWCGQKPEPKPDLNAIEQMAERGLAIGGRHAFLMHPGIFASEDAAKSAIRRATGGKDISGLPCMAPLSCMVRYQVAVAGSRAATAYAAPERFLTLRAEMEAALGALSLFEVVQPTKSGVVHMSDLDGLFVEMDRKFSDPLFIVGIVRNVLESDGEDADMDDVPDPEVERILAPWVDAFVAAHTAYRAAHPLPDISGVLEAYAAQRGL